MRKRTLVSFCLTALLAGCGPARNQFAPPCPAPQLVTPLADLTRYDTSSNRRDITDTIVQARVVSLNGSCQQGDSAATIATTVRIGLSVQRGPAMKGRDVDLPVFLAVTLGGDIRDKHVYPVHVTFPPNVDRVNLTSPPIELTIPVSGNVTGASYSLIAGFQLTPAELATNEADHGPKL
ncbi:MAG TPA: hypothetical protein VHB27_19045 [Rhodopila sp.]|uniref:hypothetical protein n=1 Tax=Rhodopila sp. TaxID=2480087 RepID=UPI002B866DF8|nr:hypothetical protein [Rhodopila sp.]HVY17328.1 hypothetical protein [Rhodopila sp.]